MAERLVAHLVPLHVSVCRPKAGFTGRMGDWGYVLEVHGRTWWAK